jgi:hypothetical protein
MADKRISQLIERTDIANNDVLPIVASGATTTNKVTISTIQDWMQDNLDVGVTSVGITLGTTGNDVNVTGSPVTTSGNITINIPTATSTVRGVLSSADWSTFNNKVPYTGATSSVNLGNNSLSASQININGASPTGGSYLGFKHSTSVTTGTDGYTSMYTFGTNNIGFQSVSGATQKDFSFSMVNITAGVPGGRTYNLPDASGTLALTSDITSALTGYVTLGTVQTITAQKTFTTSGSGNTINVNHTSGSGHGVEITKAGNGEGLRVIKTSGTGNAVTITGGTLSAEAGQFSGDLQSATRVIAAASSQSIILTPNSGGTTNRVESVGTLPLALVSAAAITMAAGGTTPQITLATTGAVTLTGALNGTSASFSGSVGAASLSGAFATLSNFGSATSTALQLGDANNGLFRPALNSVAIATNGSAALTLASTGAATFSSSVTSKGLQSIDAANTWSFSTGSNASTPNIVALGTISGTPSIQGFNFGFSSNQNLALQPQSGNVGIGTASPIDTLQVNGGVTFGSDSTSANRSRIFESFGLQIESGAAGGGRPIVFNTNLTERMRITSVGNVGIGTASPGVRLDSLGVVRSGTTSLVANGLIGAFGFGSPNYSSTLFAEISSNFEGANWFNGANLIFKTSSSGDITANSSVERMRITSGGFLKASNTGTYINTAGTYHEFSNSNGGSVTMYLRSHGSVNGSGIFATTPLADTSEYFFGGNSDGVSRVRIYTNGNIQNQNNSYGSLSDIKLKENIEDATPKLDDLLKVKVRNYNLIGSEIKQIGVIAQELEEVFPAMIDESTDFEEVEVPQLDEEGNEVLNEEGEVVTTTQRVIKGTTTKSVKYSVFVPMLIKAIQEQQEIINEMKAEIDSLKNQIK